MNEEQRFIKYLERVKPPEIESPNHRRCLRWELLNEIERRQQQMAFKKKPLRIVYILAALVCISALAIAGAHWHFWGKVNGKYVFTTAPENTEIDEDGNAVVHGGSIASISSTDPNYTLDDAKRSLERLAEIDRLREQDKRELVRVTEIKVGDAVYRGYLYKYVLADGSEATVAEGAENIPGKSGKVSGDDVGEVYERLSAGKKGELLGTEEREVKGKIFTFEKYKLTLDDGRDVILSIGTSKEE